MRSGSRRLPSALVVVGLLCLVVIAVGIAMASDMDEEGGMAVADPPMTTAVEQTTAAAVDLGIDGEDPVTGEPVALADHRGRPVVLVVWASWCEICNAEAPLIRDVAARNADVQFIGIDIADQPSGAKAFYDRHGWTFPSIDDPQRERMARVGVPGQPSFIFLDRGGAIVGRVIGAASEAELEQGMAAAPRVIGADPAGLAVAFAAGALTFASPCVLPVVPGYLAVLTASSDGDPRSRRGTATIAAFVAGFGAVFTLLGASAGLLGDALLEHRRGLEIVGGAFLILAGAALAGAALPGLLGRDTRRHADVLLRRRVGPAAAAAGGAAFALGWSPCIGPTLGAVLTLAASEGSAWEGMALLAMFSAGLAVPFVAVGLGVGHALGGSPSLRRYVPTIRLTGAAVMVGAGTLLVTGQFAALSARLGGLGDVAI